MPSCAESGRCDGADAAVGRKELGFGGLSEGWPFGVELRLVVVREPRDGGLRRAYRLEHGSCIGPALGAVVAKRLVDELTELDRQVRCDRRDGWRRQADGECESLGGGLGL